MAKKHKKTSTGTPFHITIGASPSGTITLQSESRMIKAALLYGDRVTLCSATASLIFGVVSIKDLKPARQVEFLQVLGPVLRSDPEEAVALVTGLEGYKELRKKKQKPKEELLLKAQFEQRLRHGWEGIRETCLQIAEQAGTGDIVDAIKAGLLELKTLPMREGVDELVMEFVETVGNAIADGRTFPLFDDSTGSLVAAAVREGSMTPGEVAVARGRNVALAANLFKRLPLFDLATVSDILSIRSELERALIRFRQGMISFSEKMKSASWDEEFAAEADQVFYRDVEAAVLEIEELLESNVYLREFVRRLVDKSLYTSTSYLGVIAAQVAHLPGFTSLAFGAAGAIGVAAQAYDAYGEWAKGQHEAEGNQLYFYYRTREWLANLDE